MLFCQNLLRMTVLINFHLFSPSPSITCSFIYNFSKEPGQAEKLNAADKLNRDLEVISNWAHQWKMQFNPDKNKQAIQVIFSQKKDAVIHPAVLFNGSEVAVKMEHKH